MVCIGLRATPKEVYYSIIREKEDELEVEVIDKFIIPKALSVPDKLSYIHTLLFTVINEYSVEKAVLRRCEDNAQTKDTFRLYLEGVIQELISNCTISKYDACKLSELGRLLGKKDKELKQCVDGENIFEFDNWSFKKEERESILCALAAINL